MSNLPPHPDTGLDPEGGSTTSTSRWVYVLWIIGISLVVLVVVLHLTGTVGPHAHWAPSQF